MAALDAVARETMVFAVIGFLVGGCDDLAIDLTWIWVTVRRGRPLMAHTLDAYPQTPARRIAVFVAAWDESAVIGAMLGSALARFDHADYRLYVGTYPNDRATIDAVAAVAAGDDRVRLVINDRAGPTTKADCLNAVWRALERDEARDGVTVAAVVLHDAEDLVHPGELRVFDALIGRYAVVQLPVLPLVDRYAPLVSGHYADEFADAHGRQLVVRQALGVGLPLAGVGCAIERDMLGRIAAARGGSPFDAGSIVEDYELGLLVATLGGRGVLARVRTRARGELVAVRAYFPATVPTAVRQKARWMTGIALAGWDRIRWGHALDWRDHWMRMRDRRAPLAVLVLFCAYAALLTWGAALLAHALTGTVAAPPSAAMRRLLELNGGLLTWRLVWRAAATGAAYGWREALWSLPRALVSNYVALLAARGAMSAYIRSLRGAALRWDKTSHVFPGATEPADSCQTR
ncbi:glycosyl transferase family protein [Sphingomonas glacialis]|uniref:Glycosyl transferase family protein n=1 Tax=Sphingomonas glacialis TaxID=658225 RepID=A0A502FTV7_9SPHN|nr:glycosyl transferase family protein [Sphingomonas glacialis]TPG52692.1 glycosyl transferase family protein [Sphingomonas glacialis]